MTISRFLVGFVFFLCLPNHSFVSLKNILAHPDVFSAFTQNWNGIKVLQ